MSLINIDDIKLSQKIIDILKKNKYTHVYKDIKDLEKNRKIQVKFIGEIEKYKNIDYAIFEVYYKHKNKITLLKQNELNLNYKTLCRIYIKWDEVF